MRKPTALALTRTGASSLRRGQKAGEVDIGLLSVSNVSNAIFGFGVLFMGGHGINCRTTRWLAALAFLMCSIEAGAKQLPVALRGNSIAVGWTEVRTIKGISGSNSGREISYRFDVTLKLYVSVYGRVFSTFKRGDEKTTYEDFDQISGTGKTRLLWRFQDGALVADTAFVQGARRISINFDDRLNACSIKIIYGREGGTKPIVFQGTFPGDDSQYEPIDSKILSTNCSMQRGNIFDHP